MPTPRSQGAESPMSCRRLSCRDKESFIRSLLRLLVMIGSVAFAAYASAKNGPGKHNYFTTKDGLVRFIDANDE
jgi:hypothetical protein